MTSRATPIFVKTPQPDTEERLVLVPPDAVSRTEGGDELLTIRTANARDATPDDLARGGWVRTPKCLCDAFCDEPCPVHARENALQDERNATIARAEKAERERDEARRVALDVVGSVGDEGIVDTVRRLAAHAMVLARTLEEREKALAALSRANLESEKERDTLRAELAEARKDREEWAAEAKDLRAEVERLTAPAEGSEGEPRIVPGSANHLEAWNAIAAFVESGGGTSSSVATQKAVVRVEDAFRRLVAFGVAHERARQQPPHDPGCDTLEVGPNLGPSTKPCNCRKQPAKDRATDEELVDLYRKVYETHGGAYIPAFCDYRRAAVLAVAARVRQERCLVAQAVAANVDIRVCEDDGGGFMVGVHESGCDEELARCVPAADVPATLARLLGEVSRG